MSWKRVVLVVAAFCVVLPVAGARAQSGDWSLAGYVGAGYLPMKDWEDFASGGERSNYHQDRLGLYLELNGAYYFGERHAVVLGVEHITKTSSLSTAVIETDSQGQEIGIMGAIATTWDFSTIPIDLSYEYHHSGRDVQADPFVGAGVGYYFSKLEADQKILADDTGMLTDESGTRDGNGFGVHLYVGIAAKLSDSLDLVTRLRGRYADGMYFSDEPGDVDVDFHGIDLTVGVRWTI
jgi:outer membrane protein W